MTYKTALSSRWCKKNIIIIIITPSPYLYVDVVVGLARSLNPRCVPVELALP